MNRRGGGGPGTCARTNALPHNHPTCHSMPPNISPHNLLPVSVTPPPHPCQPPSPPLPPPPSIPFPSSSSRCKTDSENPYTLITRRTCHHDARVISFTLTRAQGGGRYESVGSKSPSRVQQYAQPSPSRVEHYALSPSRVQQYALSKRADVFNAGIITARRASPYGGNGDSPTRGGGGGGGGGGGASSPYGASVTSVRFFFSLCLLLQTIVDSSAREEDR